MSYYQEKGGLGYIILGTLFCAPWVILTLLSRRALDCLGRDDVFRHRPWSQHGMLDGMLGMNGESGNFSFD